MNATCPPEYVAPKENPPWRALFWGCISGLIAAFVGYISTQQPKVWFDRQWCGLALCRGGYRSWTLSFCDGFTLAPLKKEITTQDLSHPPIETRFKMVPVTIDEKKGTMRYGYHWPTYSHSDLRPFLKRNNLGDGWNAQNIIVQSNVVFTVTNIGNLRFDWGTNGPTFPKMSSPNPNDAFYATNLVMTNQWFIIWEPPRQLVPQPRPVLNAADNFENPPENL